MLKSAHVINPRKRFWVDGQMYVFTVCGIVKSNGEVFTENLFITAPKNVPTRTDCAQCIGKVRNGTQVPDSE